MVMIHIHQDKQPPFLESNGALPFFLGVLHVETHGRASLESPRPRRRNGDIAIVLKKQFGFSHYGNDSYSSR